MHGTHNVKLKSIGGLKFMVLLRPIFFCQHLIDVFNDKNIKEREKK